ncbi:16S rRNA (guanine(527)-N(7))-methyltransferase RsmG [Mesorhizobium sp. SARCC-RB16n]|uniref:16S rRNA (guanine(527)-N(7))-methyltransferase RsmG n=1 Tax=Mesorhizobium sp. SARCC-RB16n TaxID=2116687 RepID=UPI00122ED8AD|nr:16S rRNA (guanine(527)-N(7))-methyltransferase RsmG [Mesorhizobium sp. SARCC-RB16n]KAA3441788.1 16S rRNA (guanine(527)-N(7))-methyltransferase RsmG [Mesorhizobium sp. SARCC-RB16n]
MSSFSLKSLQDAAGPVSRETFECLVAFEELFQKWNRSINLVAQSTSADVWHRHILDSAQLARIEPEARHWVDIGSGGGFPGLVMAFLLAERPGASIDLVESNRKKASFLQTVIGQFSLPARVVARRIEDSHVLVSKPQIVTARALAPLSVLLDLSAPWLASGARALFHKGRDYRAEVQESVNRWTFDLVEHPSVTDASGVILELSHVRPV